MIEKALSDIGLGFIYLNGGVAAVRITGEGDNPCKELERYLSVSFFKISSFGIK